MNVGYFGVGTLLLVIGILDILWTTVWVEGGAGPITSRTMAWTWKSLRRVTSRDSKLLTLSGPLVLVLTLVTWILLLWIGWTFLFASADRAIIDTVDSRPVSWSELLYFTGYTVFTLGIGDFVPQGGLWQIATAVASASGLLFITLSVTYVLSVLGAVTQKHAFASAVSGLGTSSTEILERSWDGETFQGLDISLDAVANQLDTLTSNHLAYPVLHYFYTRDPERAPTINIAVLDDALTLLASGVTESDRPAKIILTASRESVHRYIDTIESAYVESATRSPPSPDITGLREAGIPTVSDEQFSEDIAKLDDRRRVLLGIIESDAREWPTRSDEQDD